MNNKYEMVKNGIGGVSVITPDGDAIAITYADDQSYGELKLLLNDINGRI